MHSHAVIPVVWFSPDPDEVLIDGPCCWDQGLLAATLRRDTWRPPGAMDYFSFDRTARSPYCNGLFVVPARYYVDRVDWLRGTLSDDPRAVVILTSDEESLFPAGAFDDLPNVRVWTMTPRAGVHPPGRRYLGEGWAPHFPELVAPHAVRDFNRSGWFFAGQITHERRQQMAKVLGSLHHTSGLLLPSSGFTQGLPHDEYARQMAQAKVVPCPSGPATQDSFRLYEALEAGCVPVADGLTPKGQAGYWPLVLDEEPPFPVVEDWAEFPTVLADTLERWPTPATRLSAWWQQRKRRLALDLDSDVRRVSGVRGSVDNLADHITVLIPTSPIPSHPSPDIIQQTIASIREQPGLEDVEVLVGCDGVRWEQQYRSEAYEAYLRTLTLWSEHHRDGRQVLPVIFDGHQHQANVTRELLRLVRTPLVLFVEHDTPITGDIDWRGLIRVLSGRDVNLVRFHHEAAVLDVHQYLMLDRSPQDVSGVPLLRCAQWSQRPHLARTDYYRRVLKRHFGYGCRTMIEDVMHGVLAEAFNIGSHRGWEEHKVWMYAPPGNLKRSENLDGRESDQKYDMVFEPGRP